MVNDTTQQIKYSGTGFCRALGSNSIDCQTTNIARNEAKQQTPNNAAKQPNSKSKQ